MLLILTILGCAPTCEDVEGAVCADDVAALQERIDQLEAAGTAYAWFDQDGTQVTDGPELVWFDDEGVLWQVDVNAGVPTAPGRTTDFAGTVFFLEADCGGAGYYATLPPPLTAFFMDANTGEDDPIFVRAKESTSRTETAGWRADDGECREWTAPREQVLVAVDDVTEVQRPSVVWVAPLFPMEL